MAAPEIKETPQIPEGVEQRAEQVDIPVDIERAGVAPTPTQVTVQVTDDAGNQLIQTSATPGVVIQIPAAQEKLEDWSHGDPDKSLTWYATFWVRLIKKALHFGWRIITRGGSSAN